MRRQLLQLIGIAAVMAVPLVVLKVRTTPVAGQAPASSEEGGEAKAGPAPRTPWGEPDLQGIWTNNFETPLQRPAKYANKEFFTEEERAELDRQRAEIIGKDGRRERGSEQDVGGAYNAAIFLTHKHTGRRASLVVDPPDWGHPSFSPEASKRRAEMRAFQLALLQP